MISVYIARHLHQVHFGGNWTWVNVKDTLTDVTWEEAVMKRDGFNTIAALTFHINYYVQAILNVLKGNPMEAHDQFSLDVPEIHTEGEWQQLKNKCYAEAEELCSFIEKLPDSRLDEIFVQEKYGTYYRNFAGLTEHTHYHLGQIVILKKMIRS